MGRIRIRQRTIVLWMVAGCVAVCIVGCDSSQERSFLQQQNKKLTLRVTELEDQLEFLQEQNHHLVQRVAELENQSEPAAAFVPAAATEAPAVVETSLYIVVEGDNLWKIAEKQLGNGIRYKEILALNPHITDDKPLAIGTQLKLPPQ